METIKRIKKALRSSGIETYRINKRHSCASELFYIKKEIDITRSVETTDYSVTVYRDFEANGEKMRGSADTFIYPDMTDDEIENAIKKAYFAASFVKNKFYEIPAPEANATADAASVCEYDLTAEAFKMADALFKADDLGETCFLNSAEIFAKRSDVQVINSNGIDVSYTEYSFNGEFVTQCVENGQDVELHTQFAYRAPEYDSLTKKVKDALKNTKDRAAASVPPLAGKYAVMLSGAHVATLLDYYLSRASGSMIYPGYSSWSKDTFVQGNAEGFSGEKLDITLKATRAYSAEGIPMKNRVLTDKGVLKTVHSGARFAYYLGIEPTGDYSAMECSNGSLSLEDMRAAAGSANDKVLYVAAFSDFQADDFSGHFGGEIRLAYLYEKDKSGALKVSLLTGGSINGSILEAQGSLVFSKERYKDNSYEGPFAVRIDNINVAGV